MKSTDRKDIKQVDDFMYLGSYISPNKHDVNVRLGKAWGTLENMNKIWESNLPDNLKRNFLTATVASLLVYSSPTE